MTPPGTDMRHLQALDGRLIEVAKDIKVLSALAWPADAQARFLADWERGAPQLPAVTYGPAPDLAALDELHDIVEATVGIDHPLADYLGESARSYLTVGRMLQARGQPAMTELSVSVYGKPGATISGGRITNLDAARYFLDIANEFYQAHGLTEADYCVPANVVRARIEAAIAEVMPDAGIRVVTDPTLASKAAAGATRIRLREATCFSEYDVDQLLQHEAFVHSLTALNGRQQVNLRSLSLGAPRTTAAQEGLATFAELITGAIDISRLERIAMRILAIDMALAGADFIEVFRWFVDNGQPPTESFNSTMRVFRGAPLTGGHAFTKDGVYLHGLLEVHTFFRWALRHHRLSLCEHFFAGRMTVGDAIRLEPCFSEGLLRPPRWLPRWMTRTNGLAGFLAFSVFANGIPVQDLDLEHRFESLEANPHGQPPD